MPGEIEVHSNAVVYVAAHKQYTMPSDVVLYEPVHVGAAESKQVFDGYLRDDAADSISAKNPNYCELTAMYWAWKNSDAQAIGLAHYRRYLCSKRQRSFDALLTQDEIVRLLADSEMILPNKRRYYIETNESHYVHAHKAEPLHVLRQVIHESYPAYVPAFETVMKRRSAHMFNVLIARRDVFDAYSQWLFDVLAAVEVRVDISNYDAVEARVFGYLSELLLDVWITKNQISFVEKPCVFMEKQNWLFKGGRFVRRKLLGSVQ